jgi:glyoxylase-like metal-dependent hydrolase (beta-lactamase superfamily II)
LIAPGGVRVCCATRLEEAHGINLRLVQDRLTLVEDGDEIVPGIRVVATYGHTPGHIALSITSEGQQPITKR